MRSERLAARVPIIALSAGTGLLVLLVVLVFRQVLVPAVGVNDVTPGWRLLRNLTRVSPYEPRCRSHILLATRRLIK